MGKWSKDIMPLPYPEPDIGGNFAKDGKRKKNLRHWNREKH